jgi:hypothetical protein
MGVDIRTIGFRRQFQGQRRPVDARSWRARERHSDQIGNPGVIDKARLAMDEASGLQLTKGLSYRAIAQQRSGRNILLV